MAEVVTIGETMIRLTAPLESSLENAEILRVDVAGAESNVAIGLARLGHSSGWISRLVDNPLGRRVVNKIREHGVDTSRVIWTSDGRVGTYYLQLGRSPRASQVIYDRAASAMSLIDPGEIDWEYVGRARLLHLTGITPALSENCRAVAERTLAVAAENKIQVSLDVNYRARLWNAGEARQALGPLLSGVHIVFCTREEAEIVFGVAGEAEELAENLAETYHLPLAVVTAGEQGAAAFAQGRTYRAGGYQVGSVDRVGAGDAFVAGFLAGYLEEGVERGLEFGTAISALKHTYMGDIPWCTREDVLDLIASGGKKAFDR